MKIIHCLTPRPVKFWTTLIIWSISGLFPLYAALLERVDVEGVSSSGKSVILNSGHLEGLFVGDYAEILRVVGEGQKPRLKSIGFAEAVRVTPRESYWFFHDQNRAFGLKTGNRVSLIRQGQSLKGLREQKILQKKVVLSSGQKIEDELQARQVGVPDSLVSKHQRDYQSDDINLKTRKNGEFDIETSQYDVWSKKNNPDFIEDKLREFEVAYIGELENVSGEEEVRREDNQEVFRSYVKNVIETINSQKDGLNELYQRDMDKNYKAYVGDLIVKRNLYSQVTEPEDERIGRKPHILQKVKRDGPLWSSDLSDQQLRDAMVKSGLAEELKRTDAATLEERKAHEVILRASTGLVKHTNLDDPNFQNVNYSLSASYEYALQRASELLTAWTVEAEVYTGINFYEFAPELNGRFNESGFGAALNYYFYNKPYTLDKVAFYGGLGLRRSSATGSSSLLEGKQSYEYQVLSLPIYHLGAKYRFKAGDSYKDDFKVGMGLNVLLSFESKNLSIIGEDELQGPVFSSFDIQDTRLAVGLSLYF